MEKIIVTRTSSLPNRNNSYAYTVTGAIPDGVAGIYTPTGTTVKLLYSPARLGKLNVATEVEYRLVTAKSKTSGKDEQYINLINPATELTGEFADINSQAERGGFSGNNVLMNRYANERLGKVQVPQASTTAEPIAKAEPAATSAVA